MNAVVLPERELTPVPPANMLELIMRAASDPNVDVAKTEKLLEMYERIQAQQAKAAFFAAMTACQKQMPSIFRNRKNESSNSFFADLEQIDKGARPIYTAHGFSLSFGTADCPIAGSARVTCLVGHEKGHERLYQADIPLDLTGPKGNQNKTGTQGFGSTMSYGQRYLTKLIFNLTLTNEDNDGQDETETVSEEQIANLEALISEVGANKPAFLKYLKVGSLSEIYAARYSDVVKLLEAKRRQPK